MTKTITSSALERALHLRDLSDPLSGLWRITSRQSFGARTILKEARDGMVSSSEDLQEDQPLFVRR